MCFSALLRAALRAPWLRVALVATLLLAQHGALTHAAAIAHAATAHAGPTPIDHDSRDPAGTVVESCVLDFAYSQVLGGVHAGHDLAFSAAEQLLVVTAILAVRNSATVVPYDSRGPPVIS